MAVVSDIEIRLRADIAKLQQDMDAARRSVGGAMDGITKMAKTAGLALAGLAAGLSIGAFAGWIKGAIDATDVVSDLSQKTGVAIKDIAGLQLWFQKGGMEAGAFESSMVKLSKNIAEGGEAFDRLGIKTKDANGQLRSNVSVLLETADKFSGLQDGTLKTSLAMEIFGKTGADLLPMLNEGSEGLQKMNDMATKLGITFDEKTVNAAGDFNDTMDFLGLASQGVARQIAAQLLPTLNSLAGTFLETATKGGMVTKVADGIGFALKGLYTIGVGIVTVFTTVGNTLGAAMAQVVAILKGEFSTAAQIGREWQQDTKDGWSDAAKTISDAWSGAGGETVAALASMSKTSTVVADKVDKEAKKQIESYNALIGAIREKVRESAAEAAGMQALNDAQKMAIKLDEDIAAGKVNLTKAQEAAVRSKIAEYAANLELIDSQKEFKAMGDELAKLDAARVAENKKLVDGAREEAEAQENLVLTFGMTKAAIAQLEVARLEDQLAQKDSNNLTYEEIETLKQLIFYKKRAAEATASGEMQEKQRDDAKAAAAEQIKFWESIDKTAHDTFVSIMDGGKGAAQRLKDTFKNVFFDWLYQMTLKKWIVNLQPEIGAVGSSLGGSNGLSGLSGLSNLLGNGSGSLASVLSQGIQKGFDSLGLSMGSGAPGSLAQYAGAAGSIAAGYGLGSSANSMISGQYSVGGSSIQKIATAAASAYFGPIGGAVTGAVLGLVNRAFGRGPKTTTAQGIEGTFGADSFSGNSFNDWIKKGGWFRSDKKGTDTAALGADQAGALNTTYKAIKDATSLFATALGQSTDTITGYTKAIKLTLTGDATKDQQLLADLFADMGDELATRVLPSIAQFIRDGETASTTLQRLATEFQTVDAVLATLGVSSQEAFGAVGIVSLEARTRLVELTGGIEALAQQTSFFAENFMTDAERITPVQKALNEQLAALGLAGITTAEQYKAAVMNLATSGGLATEAGAKLLALGPSFKAVTDYMEQTKAAADELARSQTQIARDAVGEAFNALQRSINSRKAGITTAFNEVMAGIENSITDASGRLGNLEGLSSLLNGTRAGAVAGPDRAAGQAQILAALAIAKASGILPTADSLQSALQAVSQDAQDQFSSFVDYQRDALLTQNSIEELSGLTETEMSVAKQQLQVLQDQKSATQNAYDEQIARLDGIMISAQLQLDAINGVNVSIVSLREALMAFNNAASAAYQNPGVAAGPSAAEGKIEALYQSVFGRNSDAGGLSYYSNLLRGGTSLSDIEAGLRNSEEYRSQSHVYSSQQSGTMAATSTDTGARFEAMETSLNEIAAATTQFARQFNQVSAGGNALATETL